MFRWPKDAQEKVSVFQVSDQGAGEGVLLQRLHQQREAHAAFADAQPDGPPGKDMVSEPQDEREEAQQRPFTVLHHERPAMNAASRTFRDTG